MCPVATLAITASTGGFSSHPAFCFLAATSALQCVWSISLFFLHLYALLSGQWPLENHHWIVGPASRIAGDGVTAALSLFAASAASGVVMLVDDDLKLCATLLHCARFRAAAWMGFVGFIALLPTLLFNWLKLNNAGN